MIRPAALLIFLLSGAVASAQGDLHSSFREAFVASIRGLDKVYPLEGFTRTNLVKNETAGVNTIRAEKDFGSVQSADDALKALTADIETWLPAGDYTSRRSFSSAYHDSMKTLFEFNSPKMADQQKRPVVELGVEESSSGARLVLILMEPYFKGQYKPAMP